MLDYPLMPAAKLTAKKFEAALERTRDLQWVIARIPLDLTKIWGKRGQMRVQGEVNGFSFSSTIFPDGNGGHFLLVNKKMQQGGKTTLGLTAKFLLQPDNTPRTDVSAPKELLRELGESKRLLKFYESLNRSAKHWIAKWTAEPKSEDARKRRSQQIAERLMETMEAEKELPPMIELAFRHNPLARAKWEKTSPSHRRAHLLAIFYYRTPESRMRRIEKCMEELSGTGKKSRDKEQEEF